MFSWNPSCVLESLVLFLFLLKSKIHTLHLLQRAYYTPSPTYHLTYSSTTTTIAMAPIQLVNKPVGPIGFGLMGLTWRGEHNPPTPQSFATMSAALSAGANFWNGGEIYGTPERNSLHLLHEYFSQHPADAERVVLSIKGGMRPGTRSIDGSAAGVRRSVGECVRVLAGTKKVDIFECARVDPATPIEETVAALAELVREGQIGGIGLSEVSATTIRRAHAVHPIAAVEVELSLWATDVLHNGVAATCAELGVPLVAYSPLSRGALTAQRPRTNADFTGHLRHFPKFQDEVLAGNMRLSDEVERLAAKKGVTMPQVAIAWVRSLSGRKGLGTIVPIPGSTTEERVRENSEVVVLTNEEMDEIDGILKRNEVKGGRYPAAVSHLNEG